MPVWAEPPEHSSKVQTACLCNLEGLDHLGDALPLPLVQHRHRDDVRAVPVVALKHCLHEKVM